MQTNRLFAEAVLRRIAGEYREMPGLMLTVAQASRLWAFDLASSQAALESLVELGVLRRTRDGFYGLRSDSPTRARGLRLRASLTPAGPSALS